MNRYHMITNKNRREIVLLKAFPCAWGKCSFCDYTDDNSTDEAFINRCNKEVLSQVKGTFGVLEVINSGSCFELPADTLTEIKRVVMDKKISRIYFESHWMYRNKLEQIRRFIGVEVLFKIGVETFDNDFRENYLNKHAGFKTPQEVSAYFDSPCLMVGVAGQTKEMIAYDIEMLKTHFKMGTVNVYTNNTTSVKRDDKLCEWFMDAYSWLLEDPDVEVLYKNTDFGVGD